MTSKLYPFTAKDSGITINIKKVSFRLAQDIAKQYEKEHPKPTPPLNAVDYGDGKIVQEPNVADPAYDMALKVWNGQLEEATAKVYINLGVHCTIDQDEVKAIRDAVKGATLDASDKYIYVAYVVAPTPEDYNDLITAISRRSHGTEGAINETLDSFPSQV